MSKTKCPDFSICILFSFYVGILYSFVQNRIKEEEMMEIK